VAATLLVAAGETGLQGLQAGAVSAGFPFAIVLVFATWSLLRGLKQEIEPRPAGRHEAPPMVVTDAVRRERAARQRELDLRERELEAKERELDVRERELEDVTIDGGRPQT
jgi:choline-glycine betaine transporter